MRKREASSILSPVIAQRLWPVLIALLCICADRASAQEERAIGNFAGVGVRAMGMGGAFAGVADDFTAMYWNPAGLAQMTNREVRVSFLRNGRETKSTFNGT